MHPYCEIIFQTVNMVWWNKVNDIEKVIPNTIKQHIKLNINKQLKYVRKL